jgi:hypothetical protein
MERARRMTEVSATVRALYRFVLPVDYLSKAIPGPTLKISARSLGLSPGLEHQPHVARIGLSDPISQPPAAA